MRRESDNRGGTEGVSRMEPPGPLLNPNDELPPPCLPQLPEISLRIDHGHPSGPTDPTDPKLLSAATTTTNPTTPTTNASTTTTIPSGSNSGCTTSHVGVPKEVQQSPVIGIGDSGGVQVQVQVRVTKEMTLTDVIPRPPSKAW